MGGRPPRLNPALVSARRRAAALVGNAVQHGRAGRPPARGRAARHTHQPIPVPQVDNLHTATPAAELAPGRQWYRIADQVTGGAAEVWIYDEIGYWGVSAQDFVLDLQQVQATQLNVHINSPGGEVFDGIAIYNALVSHPAEVHVTVDALAASIASVIAMAGDTITMGRHSQFMIHEPYGLCVGNAADMATMIEQLDRCADNIAAAYADRAGGTVEAWRDAMREETWYTGAEAVTAGLADAVVSNPRGGGGGGSEGDEFTVDPEEVAARWNLGVFQFAGRAEAPAPDLTLNTRSPASPLGADGGPAGTTPPTPPAPTPTPTVEPAAEADPLAALYTTTPTDPLAHLWQHEVKEPA